MIGIYKTINSIFADMLKIHGFEYSKILKSNIHPSVLYIKNNYELQIGYNYEEAAPFAYIYGTRICLPTYDGARTFLTIKDKLHEFCQLINSCLETKGHS